MANSNVNSKINRSIDGPLMLAAELSRQGLLEKDILTVVQTYKARVMATPTLSLKRSTEEATVRLMNRGKFCEAAVAVLTCITHMTNWQSGPLSADSILAPKLVIGAHLVDTCHDMWHKFALQTAGGQTTTMNHIEERLRGELAAGSPIKRYTQI